MNPLSIRITVGGIEDVDDFAAIAGLIRDTGARRTGERSFVLYGPMSITQVYALLDLYGFTSPTEGVAIEQQDEWSSEPDDLHSWWLESLKEWRARERLYHLSRQRRRGP